MKILLADDHPLFRSGLIHLIKNVNKDTNIYEAQNYYLTKKIIQKNRDLDLVLFDLSMPGVDKLSVITELKKIIPNTPIAIISAADDLQIIQQVVIYGAQGFIPKSYSLLEILNAIREVLMGNIYYPSAYNLRLQNLNHTNANLRIKTNRRFDRKKPIFTKRQRAVLILLCSGKSNEDIAGALKISISTVKTHVVNIYKLLQVSSRAEAGYSARKMDVIRKEIEYIH